MIPIILVCASYIIGIIWGLYLNICLGIVLFCLLLFIVCKVYIKIDFKKAVCLLLIFIIGVSYIQIKSYKIEKLYQEGKITVIAEILSEPEILNYYQTFIVRLNDGNKSKVYIPKNVDVNFGETIQITGVLEKPEGARNEGGFNYKNYLYSQNIFSIITASSEKNVYKIEEAKFDLIHSIQRSIYNVFSKLLPRNHMSILIGMIIGDTSETSEEVENDFKISGISHLLAVSGSNVAYIILAIKFLLNKFTSRSVSNILTILFIVLFVLISGGSASVVRAAMMAIIAIVSELVSRKSNTLASIATSALVILIYNPFVIYDIGFVLSFCGTIGIVLLNSKISSYLNSKIKSKILKMFIDTFSVTMSAQIILLPIMWRAFNTISIISLLSNLIVVPLTGVITILGIAIYFVGLIYMPVARILSYSIYVLIEFVINVASFCAKISFSQIILPTPSWLFIIIYYMVIYKIFVDSERNKSACIMISMLIVAQIIIGILPNLCTHINMIDVGQGDCIYMETINKKRILIDGGGSENSDYDVGENVLVPYVLDKGTKTIDCIILTHAHEDHIEGLISVVEKLKVNQIIVGPQPTNEFLYEKLLIVAAENNVPIKTASKGDKFYIDNVEFEVMHPENNIKFKDDLNNNSLVIKIKVDEITLLITGDIEKQAEMLIINENISANILKVAHHGSNTSTSEEFINKVSPQVALIGVGENNNFGHPAENVIERLNKIACNIFRTDNHGEVKLRLFKNGEIKINHMINE